jgi:flavin reductase (DIM6/NTAB) family NADH-FMN oxidoreductase RutF
MREILPSEIEGNVFSSINDEWMLITALKKDGSVNTMTASWGGFGIMWNKPVCLCAIRPQRYTNEFVKENDRLTLTFLKDGNREALKLCGTKSGRDTDKITDAGLRTVIDGDVAFFEQSRLVIVGRKIYVSAFKADCFTDKELLTKNYPKNDLHDIYVCEIERVLVSE